MGERKIKKVAVMGMCNYENFGDQIIAKTVHFLVKDIDYSFEPYFVNFQPERVGKKYELYKKRRQFVEKKVKGTLQHKLITLIMKDFVWKYYEEQLSQADALILACGSFKYGTQNLWTTYSLAVECAKKYGVPVMFDAMNIQKANPADWRCRFLKRHANYDCVKMITSRDGRPGVERLEEEYVNPSRIRHDSIKLYGVGDPALWTKEAYNTSLTKTDIVGINLIRADVFKDYGTNLDEEKVLQIYNEIIDELEELGIKWCLFTNGMKKDRQFGEEILAKRKLDFGKYLKVPNTDCELVEMIDGFSSIIGARLHACIIAYSLGTPFSGFYWDEKMIHFSEENELSDYFCEVSELSGKALVDKMLLAKKKGYNTELMEEWKKNTRDSIAAFLGKGE